MTSSRLQARSAVIIHTYEATSHPSEIKDIPSRNASFEWKFSITSLSGPPPTTLATTRSLRLVIIVSPSRVHVSHLLYGGGAVSRGILSMSISSTDFASNDDTWSSSPVTKGVRKAKVNRQETAVTGATTRPILSVHPTLDFPNDVYVCGEAGQPCVLHCQCEQFTFAIGQINFIIDNGCANWSN